MYWFGWEWIAHAKRIAVLVRGAVASDGVHGPRACVIWGCIMPDCWHDWTRGQSWFLARTHLCLSLIVSSMIMLFLMWLVVFIMSYTESRLHHSARLERLQAFGKCFQYSFQSQQVHCFWKPWSFSYSSGKCVVSLLQPLHWIDTLYWLGSAYKIFFVLGAWESNFDRMGSLCT